MSLSPTDSSGLISVQGIGLSKIDFAKQMLEIHEDLNVKKKNGEELKLYADKFYYFPDMFSAWYIPLPHKIFPIQSVKVLLFLCTMPQTQHRTWRLSSIVLRPWYRMQISVYSLFLTPHREGSQKILGFMLHVLLQRML
jgi:hypothetical protein